MHPLIIRHRGDAPMRLTQNVLHVCNVLEAFLMAGMTWINTHTHTCVCAISWYNLCFILVIWLIYDCLQVITSLIVHVVRLITSPQKCSRYLQHYWNALSAEASKWCTLARIYQFQFSHKSSSTNRNFLNVITVTRSLVDWVIFKVL